MQTTQKLAKNVPFNFVNGCLTIFLNEKVYTFTNEDARLPGIKQILSDKTKTEDDLTAFINTNSVENYVKESCGKVTVKNGEIYYGDELVNSVLSERIKECMKYGLPFEHMLKFMENLYNNPSSSSVNESFDFLSNESLPITDDGCFIAYKAIKNNWYDKYKGVIYNGIGAKPELPRNKVDDNRHKTCSFGLHVGALPYVESYGSGDDRIIYVKVNPADIVSVPTDHNAQKVRVCKYEVLGEYKGELNKSPMYGNDLNELGTAPSDDWDDDWDDDDYDDNNDYEEEWLDDEFDDDLYSNEHYQCGCDICSSHSHVDTKAVDEYYKGFSYGIKPSGQKYYNIRNKSGKFSKC